MWRTLGISKSDWLAAASSIQNTLVSLYLENHSINLRNHALNEQISNLNQPAARIRRLNERIIIQQTQISSLQKQLAQAKALEAETIKLKAEIADLKERVRINSQNSSLPPSMDSPFRKYKKRIHEPSGRKRGGQIGHLGETRWLLSADEVDEIVEIQPESCFKCGSRELEASKGFPECRQVTEITDAGTITTEYRRVILICRNCGKRNTPDWINETQNGSFGPRIHAVIGYLTGRLILSHRDTMEALQELFAVKISLGSISAVQKRISQVIAPAVEKIKAFVEQQTVVYVDETGWRENDRQKWFWTKSTDQAAIFEIRDRRSKHEAETVIGKNLQGIVSTDRYPGYNFIPLQNRQICWAHIKRDFQAISERDGDSKSIGEALFAETKEMFRLWQSVRDGTICWQSFLIEIESVKTRISELLIKGLLSDHQKTKRTCENILKLEYSLWTFTRIKGVEPTNNAAERALRRAVIWRKRSFGTKSKSGSKFVERILTIVQTLKLQGRSVFGFLEKLV